MAERTGDPIGGEISHATVAAALLDPEDRPLGQLEIDRLWEIFVEIGNCWGNMSGGSDSIKSSWREFIQAKITDPPSYVGEYRNCISVVQELLGMYGHGEAFRRLFLDNGIPDLPPTTRLAHAKRYVIDEFIRVQIVAGGFKGFVQPGPLNYNGYVGGSRYNLTPRVRAYRPATETGA
jgi:hypothetical protein